MSKAIIFDRYGDPDVLRLEDVDAGEPGQGQVRVRVRAAGVQPFDAIFRSGKAHQWLAAHFPQRLGNEWAGTVEATGPDATPFALGDEVLGWAMLASYAENVIVNVNQVVRKPHTMAWGEAGVVSASGQTASSAIEMLGVTAGQTLLIHAAAGGVGSFAVQIARSMGVTVIGTASERNHDYLRSIGAIPVAYGDELVERVRCASPQGVDTALVAVDSEEALRSSIELVHDKNRIGTTAFQPLARTLGIRQLSTDRSVARLNYLTKLWSDGELRITLQRALPLAQAAAAHREIESGHVRGKIVLMA